MLLHTRKRTGTLVAARNSFLLGHRRLAPVIRGLGGWSSSLSPPAGQEVAGVLGLEEQGPAKLEVDCSCLQAQIWDPRIRQHEPLTALDHHACSRADHDAERPRDPEILTQAPYLHEWRCAGAGRCPEAR